MTYFLDTNACAEYLRGNAPRLRATLRSYPPSEIRIPAIVEAELLFGARKSNRSEENLASTRAFLNPFITVPFDSSAAERYAQIRLNLERRGQVIGPDDLLIAATVLAYGGVLVTHNTSEFARVEGLRLEDWQWLTR